VAALKGRTALVTGSSRGIGAAIARELASQGARVIVNHRDSEGRANIVADDIKAAGGEACVACGDVSDCAAVTQMFDRLSERGEHVDVLVNNAGILRDRTFTKSTPEDWGRVLAVNLQGAVNATAAAVPGMISRGYGRIVNISSFVGQAGNFGQTNYAASKAGLIGFTRALALELARHGITVNAVCPGFTATDMWNSIPEDVKNKLLERIPLRRVGQPTEVAAMVRFLVAEGDYVTGQTLNVNGGIFIG
jgi:NAD(P)-dependent dehydrogenase (short-subunit alcohol dehydrogenase family)